MLTLTQAYDELMRIVNEISDYSQVCKIGPGGEAVVCPASRAHKELWALRDKLRETLVAMGSTRDIEGHRIAPWPETERLVTVAAKCGDRTPERLQEQCEELSRKIDLTPGDALDYIDELVS